VGPSSVRQWALFGPLQTTEARSWARVGNFAVQVSATGEDAWLLAKDRQELIFACGCIGASPKPWRHPIDKLGCAMLSPIGLRSARAAAQHSAHVATPSEPIWSAFAWNIRDAAMAWANDGNAALLTQPTDEGPVRWLLLPWTLAQGVPKAFGIRKPASKLKDVGWIKLSDEELWREAFLLCSQDEGRQVVASDPSAKLAFVGLRSIDRLPVRPPTRKLWDALCMAVGRQIQIVGPAKVMIGGCPWTDAAALWAMRNLDWPHPVHVYLPTEWDLDRSRYAVGDPDAYLERVKLSPNYRPYPGAEDALRTHFISKDPGGRMNRWHMDFCQEVGFDSLSALAELVDYCVGDAGHRHRFTYSCHDGLKEATEDLARQSSRMVVTALTREHVPGHARKAASRCTGRKTWVTFEDLFGAWGHAPA
jgi:hypothetical protein